MWHSTMDSFCNLLRVGWKALCTWDKGSEWKSKATELCCRKSVLSHQAASVPKTSTNHRCPQLHTRNAAPRHTAIYMPSWKPLWHLLICQRTKESKGLMQVQESKVQLQKVKQPHHRRENLLELIAKYWQARDANSNKAGWGKRRQSVK